MITPFAKGQVVVCTAHDGLNGFIEAGEVLAVLDCYPRGPTTPDRHWLKLDTRSSTGHFDPVNFRPATATEIGAALKSPDHRVDLGPRPLTKAQTHAREQLRLGYLKLINIDFSQFPDDGLYDAVPWKRLEAALGA